MRILVVTRWMDRAECRLYQGLCEAGIDVEVLCHPEAARQDKLARAGVPVEPLEVRHRLDRRAIRFLHHRITQRHYDLIYAPDNSALGTALRAARREPVRVVGYRGTTGHLHRFDPGSRLTYLHRRLDHIVCVSEAVRTYLHGTLRIPASRLTTIYKGHDAAWYPPAPPLDRCAFGIPKEAFVVAFSGRLRPVKGGMVLLRAMAELAAAGTRIHLLLIGEICDRRVSRTLRDARLRAHVHCTGYRSDAPRLVGGCDLFVMPSVNREGLPRAVIEAMAQRRPVLATRVGGLPELVLHGETGHLVPPRDPHALAAAMRLFAASPAHAASCGRRGRHRMETVFNIADTLRKTKALFARLTAPTPARSPRNLPAPDRRDTP